MVFSIQQFSNIMLTAKTVFVGDNGIGKSALLNCLVAGYQVDISEYIPRYDIDVRCYIIDNNGDCMLLMHGCLCFAAVQPHELCALVYTRYLRYYDTIALNKFDSAHTRPVSNVLWNTAGTYI